MAGIVGMVTLLAAAPAAPAVKLAMIDDVREVRTATPVVPTAITPEPTESLALAARFDAEGYDLDDVIEGSRDVPSLSLKSLPKDLVHLQDVDLKKSLFFRSLLPLAIQVNAAIAAERDRIIDLKARAEMGEPLSVRERAWLDNVARSYKTTSDNLEELALRVDTVPVSLILAQAAEESGWGTSRFVREGNALFGQWTWSAADHGIVPENRDDGETHKVRAFSNVKAAIASYVRNLNTHPAYEKFRLQRALGASAVELTAALDKYSERGAKYGGTLRTIMQANRLTALDQARLSKEILVVRR